MNHFFLSSPSTLFQTPATTIPFSDSSSFKTGAKFRSSSLGGRGYHISSWSMPYCLKGIGPGLGIILWLGATTFEYSAN